jgi:hypothetical protein
MTGDYSDAEVDLAINHAIDQGWIVERDGLLYPGPVAPPEDEPLTQWWTIHGDDLMRMLLRVAAGDSPDVVYLEAYANSTHEHP